MESWQKKLFPASFRGVPFFSTGSVEKGGWNVEIKEFPNPNAYPDIKQLGKKVKKHTISATLFSNEDGDFQDKRDALKEALFFQGSGTLIHEYYGEIEVFIAENSINQSYEDGSSCRFSFVCYEAPPEINKYSISQKNQVLTANENTINSLKNSIKDQESISNIDKNSFVNSIRNGSNKMKNVFNIVKSNVDFLNYNINSIKTSLDFKNNIANIANSILSIEDSLNDLINLPSETIDSLKDTISLISGMADSKSSKKSLLLNSLFNIGDTTSNTFSKIFDSVFLTSAVENLTDLEFTESVEINSIFDLFESKFKTIINTENGDYKLNLMALNSALFKLRIEFLDSIEKQKEIEVPNKTPLSIICWENGIFLQNQKVMLQNNFYDNPLFMEGKIKIADV